jgi:hypothetical protein
VVGWHCHKENGMLLHVLTTETISSVSLPLCTHDALAVASLYAVLLNLVSLTSMLTRTCKRH